VIRHGVTAYVHHGCRCPVCTAANTARHRPARARRWASRELIDGRLVATQAETHGTWSTYANWGCRCKPCDDAAVIENRRQREKRSQMRTFTTETKRLCVCGKNAFTEEEAEYVLVSAEQARAAGNPERMEVHKYECRHAPNVWHTSSTPRLFEGVHEVTKKGVSGLDPAELAKIADELGCTVEENGKQYKIYPPDKSHSPVFVSTRFNNGTGRSNALAQLRRAGVDVIAFLEDQRTKSKESTVNDTNGAPVGPPPLTHRPAPVGPVVQDPPRPQPVTGRPTPTKISSPPPGITQLKEQLDDLQSQVHDLLAMLVNAEKAQQSTDEKVDAVATTVNHVGKRLLDVEARTAKLETADQTRVGAITRLQTQRSQSDARIRTLEHQLRDLPGDTPRVDPNAALDAGILAVMDATPMKLNSPVIAAALPEELEATSNQVGKRLQVLAAAGEVTVIDRPGVAKFYQRVKPNKKESTNV
jgi:chaperonin cofactor prefoldin